MMRCKTLTLRTAWTCSGSSTWRSSIGSSAGETGDPRQRWDRTRNAPPRSAGALAHAISRARKSRGGHVSLEVSSLTANLLDRIQTGSATIAVVGLGYVGLPVACSFASRGFEVIGLDVVDAKVASINEGRSPIEGQEPGLDELLGVAVRGGRL